MRCAVLEPGEFFSVGDVELQLLAPGKYDASGVFVADTPWRAMHAVRRAGERIPPTERANGFPAPNPEPATRRGWLVLLAIIVVATLGLLVALVLASA